MNKTDIEDAVGLVGKLVAMLGTISAVVLFLVPRVRRAVSAYCAASDLAENFGRDAGNVIRKLLIAEGQQLSETKAMIEALSTAIHLGVYVCDSSGKCISVNGQLEHWFGLSRDQCTGFGWLSAIVDRETAFNRWSFAVANGLPYRDEYTVKNVDTGETFKAATEAVRINVDGGLVFVGFVRKL